VADLLTPEFLFFYSPFIFPLRSPEANTASPAKETVTPKRYIGSFSDGCRGIKFSRRAKKTPIKARQTPRIFFFRFPNRLALFW
jgi:hypothetical protein